VLANGQKNQNIFKYWVGCGYDLKKNPVSILWKDKNVNMGLEENIYVGIICK
jgi:hypothetical protein